MRRAFLLALVPVLALAGELTDQNWRELAAKVRPSKDELAWQIGWRPSFFAALEEAQKDEKPLLLWVMNGHPLGCT